MSETTDPFLTPRTRPLTAASSADNLRDDTFIPPNFPYRDSAYGPQPSLSLSTPRASANLNSYYDSPTASHSNNHIPLLDRDSGLATPRSYAGKEYDSYADRSSASSKKSLFKRPVFWLGLVAAIVLVAAAVVLPIYFLVIKPHNGSGSTSGASADNGKSGSNSDSGNTTTNANGQKILITGGDGSTVTKDDGTTFVYKNAFGGYCASDTHSLDRDGR